MEERWAKEQDGKTPRVSEYYDHPLFGKMRSMNEEEAELYEQMKNSHTKVYSNVNVFDL